MGRLHCDGDDDARDEAREVARCGQWIDRDRWRGRMIAVRHLGVAALPERSDPCSEPLAAKNAEAEAGGELASQYRGA
ncbi:hypothetical protein I6F30_37195 [Bradyrhizobium sp. NBAIM20]|uniref:hypothetical protein n=1 Tax=Bradyrhizobium TaxID=374 RepID=UPI001CD68E56|nr:MULTISPECIES: hypothetical protein [Bradyrhizobium]MCA1416712.1 hypothetical protein [Bradyrhizobium sp. NBAIM20]MCA1466232.1 hypothetical protein [Bradyrhizobium sp. NBAIM18]